MDLGLLQLFTLLSPVLVGTFHITLVVGLISLLFEDRFWL